MTLTHEQHAALNDEQPVTLVEVMKEQPPEGFILEKQMLHPRNIPDDRWYFEDKYGNGWYTAKQHPVGSVIEVRQEWVRECLTGKYYTKSQFAESGYAGRTYVSDIPVWQPAFTMPESLIKHCVVTACEVKRIQAITFDDLRSIGHKISQWTHLKDAIDCVFGPGTYESNKFCEVFTVGGK